MLPHIFIHFVFLIVSEVYSFSPSYPPFKLVKYKYDGPLGETNDPNLTSFRRIKESSCHIYRQEDTTDVFMYNNAAPNRSPTKVEWVISALCIFV